MQDGEIQIFNPIALMAAILGGLYFNISRLPKESFTPNEDITPTRAPSYPDYQCEKG
jgi:hypothetical protein